MTIANECAIILLVWATSKKNVRMARLGTEPLADDLTPQQLEQMLQSRRGAIKKYLLDQSFIAGIGNVY